MCKLQYKTTYLIVICRVIFVGFSTCDKSTFWMKAEPQIGPGHFTDMAMSLQYKNTKISFKRISGNKNKCTEHTSSTRQGGPSWWDPFKLLLAHNSPSPAKPRCCTCWQLLLFSIFVKSWLRVSQSHMIPNTNAYVYHWRVSTDNKR